MELQGIRGGDDEKKKISEQLYRSTGVVGGQNKLGRFFQQQKKKWCPKPCLSGPVLLAATQARSIISSAFFNEGRVTV
jgi:hypothetical protein